MARKTILALMLAFLLPQGAAAAPPAPHPCPAPQWLVDAIIKHESQGNPNAVNVGGASYFPATKGEALQIIAGAREAGTGYDIGLMQINRYWVDKYSLAPEDLLDPEINLAWGKWILAEEIARHGLTWTAVGKYHSPDRERGRGYTWHIYRAADQAKVKAWMEGKTDAEQKKARSGVSDDRGIFRREGERRPGRVVPLEVPAVDQPGPAGQKP